MLSYFIISISLNLLYFKKYLHCPYGQHCLMTVERKLSIICTCSLKILEIKAAPMFKTFFILLSICLRILLMLLQGKRKSIVKMLVCENFILRRQIQILLQRNKRRITLSPWDRLYLAFGLGLSNTKRLSTRVSIILSPETLLRYHRHLVKMKYSKLYTPIITKKRGPKRKSKELVQLVLALKNNNPSYGAEKIAGILSRRGYKISDTTVRRILKKHGYDDEIKASGPSWLSFIGNSLNGLWSVDYFKVESICLKSYLVMVVIDVYSRKIIGFSVEKYPLTGSKLCRMFNKILNSSGIIPKRISTDNDPLFLYNQWLGNLSILDIDEIKTVSHVPWSHPYVERVIGITRQEYLRNIIFFGEVDLLTKLDEFQKYYNEGRVHSSIDFCTPHEKEDSKKPNTIELEDIKWKSYCRGLYKVPIAA